MSCKVSPDNITNTMSQANNYTSSDGQQIICETNNSKTPIINGGITSPTTTNAGAAATDNNKPSNASSGAHHQASSNIENVLKAQKRHQHPTTTTIDKDGCTD